MSLYGVTFRWSLHAVASGVAGELRSYVARVSQVAQSARDEPPGLHQTLWTLREGGSFGETSVWRSEQARANFMQLRRAQASPVSAILGHSPDAIEEFDVLAIADSATSAVPEEVRSPATGTAPSSGKRWPAS
jgi:hypothetical protein